MKLRLIVDVIVALGVRYGKVILLVGMFRGNVLFCFLDNEKCFSPSETRQAARDLHSNVVEIFVTIVPSLEQFITTDLWRLVD